MGIRLTEIAPSRLKTVCENDHLLVVASTSNSFASRYLLSLGPLAKNREHLSALVRWPTLRRILWQRVLMSSSLEMSRISSISRSFFSNSSRSASRTGAEAEGEGDLGPPVRDPSRAPRLPPSPWPSGPLSHCWKSSPVTDFRLARGTMDVSLASPFSSDKKIREMATYQEPSITKGLPLTNKHIQSTHWGHSTIHAKQIQRQFCYRSFALQARH